MTGSRLRSPRKNCGLTSQQPQPRLEHEDYEWKLALSLGKAGAWSGSGTGKRNILIAAFTGKRGWCFAHDHMSGYVWTIFTSAVVPAWSSDTIKQSLVKCIFLWNPSALVPNMLGFRSRPKTQAAQKMESPDFVRLCSSLIFSNNCSVIWGLRCTSEPLNVLISLMVVLKYHRSGKLHSKCRIRVMLRYARQICSTFRSVKSETGTGTMSLFVEGDIWLLVRLVCLLRVSREGLISVNGHLLLQLFN